jgi:hypothetical protein
MQTSSVSSRPRAGSASRVPAAVFGAIIMGFVVMSGIAHAQTWTALNNSAPFNASTALLLTDGTVMVAGLATTDGFGSGQWWKLTPDNEGSYLNGTWSQLASLPGGYAPLYFASAVLPDGRVIVEGGEYNGSAQTETNLGAIYQPTSNTWTPVSPPAGWPNIGDGQSVVLPNGTFMLGNCNYPAGSLCNSSLLTQQALLNPSTLTWTVIAAPGKADPKSEEGWTLLPSGNVLTVDLENGTASEVYNSTTQSWSSAGSTGNTLINSSCDGGFETGPAVLRPDGTVFALGGLGYTGIYNSGTGAWSAGPPLPFGLGVDDGPAALLPDGNVLLMASPYSPCYAPGSSFYEFDGSTLTPVAGPPNASVDTSYYGRMLVLPTGQILFTDGSSNVQIYTPAGTYQESWQPTITSVASNLKAGVTYTITGTQFNGLSQGAMYGDDAQMATNFPLVRITNERTGHVLYARTHDHSTMAVATGSTSVSTQFDVPANIESGTSTLEVVANGIPSLPVTLPVGSDVPAIMAPIISYILN